MTYERLESLFYLSLEIQRLEQRILALRTSTLGSSAMDGMPHGSSVGTPTEDLAELRAELIDDLEELHRQKLAEEIEITQYIESVEDEEIKTIMYLRFIECMSWADVSAAMSSRWKHPCRTTCSRKIKDYLRNSK